MANQKKPADISGFYVWLESMAKRSDHVAIHTEDAMQTGLRLQDIPSQQRMLRCIQYR
jgi:hypothetical protein